MATLTDATVAQIAAAGGFIIAAIIAGILALYGQWKLKQWDIRFQRRKERENQRLKFYLPLLRFCYDLDRRLGHILSTLDTDWLNASHLQRIKVKEGFAKAPNEKGYFIVSSLYILACFFGWSEAIKRSGDTRQIFKERGKVRKWFSRQRRRLQSLFRGGGERGIFRFDPDISTVSKLFQYEELFAEYITSRPLVDMRDACKLHKQLQYSIGELMLERDPSGGWRCKSFREFYEAYVEREAFRFWFVKLEDLLVDLSAFTSGKTLEAQVELKKDIRPLRLLAIRYWCRILMRNISEELDIETPLAEEALGGVSAELAATIKGVEIAKLESYLLGIRLNNS